MSNSEVVAPFIVPEVRECNGGTSGDHPRCWDVNGGCPAAHGLAPIRHKGVPK